MRNFFIITILLLFVLSGLFGGLYYFFGREGIEKEPNERPKKVISIDISDPNYEPKSSAWIPYWDYKRGLETMKANEGSFYQVNPVIYEVREDGTLKKTKGDTYQPIQEYADEEGILFVPSIAMFDHNLFSKVLNDPENLDRHVNAIVGEIEIEEYDGIDLDYESIKLVDKDEFNTFITNLSERIEELEKEEDREIIFSVTVMAKWGDNTRYASLKETREVQDWVFLGQKADEIKIMAYDYTSQQSAEPGPIAPIYWSDLVLQKAVREIPSEKVVLGVATYGYNWATTDSRINGDINSNLPTGKIKADAYTYDQIVGIQEKYKGELKYDDAIGEAIYTYTRPEGHRTLIFSTPQSLKDRKELAKKHKIRGVAYWRLGGDSKLDY